MKAVNDYEMTPTVVFIIVSAIVVSFDVITILNVVWNEPVLSDMVLIIMTTMSLILVSTVILALMAVGIDNLTVMASFGVVVVMSGVVVFVMFDAHSSILYFEDCITLRDISDTNVDECIAYATANTNATGAEIVDALTLKVAEVPDVDTNVLDRPLNP